VFFTGSADFTRANVAAARLAGAKIIDLSGALVGDAGTLAWFPGLDALRAQVSSKDAAVYAIPSAAAKAAAALSLGLMPIGLRHLVFVCFQPVSEAGRAGIEELESQTSHLLSFHSIGTPVFDTQVAFTLLDRFGSASSQKLAKVRERIRAETRALLAGKTSMPAVQVVHAPVFYGTTFAACAEVESNKDAQEVLKACKQSGFAINAEDEGPSNVTAAGESVIQLAPPEADSAQAGTWCFWGAADNIRLPAANAVKLAEMLS
jgi:aspartate-semialdehyde dehydrogenase